MCARVGVRVGVCACVVSCNSLLIATLHDGVLVLVAGTHAAPRAPGSEELLVVVAQKDCPP